MIAVLATATSSGTSPSANPKVTSASPWVAITAVARVTAAPITTPFCTSTATAASSSAAAKTCIGSRIAVICAWWPSHRRAIVLTNADSLEPDSSCTASWDSLEICVISSAKARRSFAQPRNSSSSTPGHGRPTK